MARVIIVGAGVGGLATAARLADFGHEVTVYERADAVGGRVRPRAHRGFTFHADPAPLPLPAVYRDLFRKTGRPLERVLDLVALDPGIGYRFSDGTHVDLPHASRAGATAAFDATFGPGSGAAWRGVVDHGRAVWDVVRSPYLDATATSRDLLRLCRPSAVRVLEPWRSLRSAGRARLTDHRMRMIVEHAATGDPRRAPAALTVVPYLNETFGRWHVAGGPGALAAALAGRAIERGASVLTGAEVRDVTVDAARVTGVRLLDGGYVPADVVVATGGQAVVGGLARVRTARLTPSAPFTVHLALRDAVPRIPAHTVCFPTSTDPSLDDVYGPSPRPPADPAIDIYAPPDPALRPPGATAAWTLVAHVPAPHRFDWGQPGRTERYADHLLGVLAARGLDIAPQVEHRLILSPLDRLEESGSSGGEAWPAGLGVAPLRRRPRNRTGVRGLFLAGSAAYPGPGLALVGLSSLMVADLIGRA